ncbi:MAG: hypothetical protein IPL46_27760 [Saprospiraceae bacterium]|nr:hypothetical protein [Saprospiraceae bacterium]
MKFPIANISIKSWNPTEDYLMYILLDPFIYRDSTKLYNEFFFNNEFVDSTGEIYRIVNWKKPVSLWRTLFKFLPMVYKIELIFKKVEKKMVLEEVREFVLRQINQLPMDDDKKGLIDQVNKAKTI